MKLLRLKLIQNKLMLHISCQILKTYWLIFLSLKSFSFFNYFYSKLVRIKYQSIISFSIDMYSIVLHKITKNTQKYIHFTCEKSLINDKKCWSKKKFLIIFLRSFCLSLILTLSLILSLFLSISLYLSLSLSCSL